MSETPRPPRLFDAALIERRLARADFAGDGGFLMRRLADDLAERLALIKRDFKTALDIGSPGAAVREALAMRGIRVTPVPLADTLPLEPQSQELIVSVGIAQVVDDLPGLMIQCARALKPDGLLMMALAGGETLTELRQCLMAAEAEIEGGASPRVIPFGDVRTLGALLQRAGLALPVADSDTLTVRYDNLLSLMQDIKAMGAANPLHARRRGGLRPATLMRAAELYAERFADGDGRIRASIEIVWLSGWKPHESQQKPLKPGSAQMRLADVLNAQVQKPRS